jgi:hypothetical protein
LPAADCLPARDGVKISVQVALEQRQPTTKSLTHPLIPSRPCPALPCPHPAACRLLGFLWAAQLAALLLQGSLSCGDFAAGILHPAAIPGAGRRGGSLRWAWGLHGFHMSGWVGQGRAGQGRAGQDRTEMGQGCCRDSCHMCAIR